MAYEYFIFCTETGRNPIPVLAELISTLYQNRSLKPEIITSQKHLYIQFKNYQFRFIFIDEDWIIEESKEIANSFCKSHPKKKQILANSRTRIEFYGEDDPEMEFFNEHLFIFEHINNNPKFLIFNYPQGNWFEDSS